MHTSRGFQWAVLVIGTLLTGTVFITDLFTPLGIAGSAAYLAVVFLTLWLPGQRYTLGFAVACTVLTVLGLIWTPLEGAALTAVTERMLTLLAIWVAVTLVLHYRRLEAEMNGHFSLADDYRCVVDARGRFLRVNPALAAVLGYASDVLLGRSVLAFIHPEDRSHVRAGFAAQLFDGCAHRFDARFRVAGNAYRWLSWTSRFHPFVGQAYATLYDLSEKKRHASLNDFSAQFTAILDTAPVACVVLDPNYRIVSSNPAFQEAFGCSASDLIGAPFERFVDRAEDGDDPRMVWPSPDLADARLPTRWSLKRANGEIVPGELFGSPIRAENGDLLGYTAWIRSGPERPSDAGPPDRDAPGETGPERLAVMRNELIVKTRLATIGQIAAGIAHELRNPLGVIRNAVYYLRHHPGDTPLSLDEYLDLIDREVASGDHIITTLLNVGRSTPPDKRRIDLHQEVEACFGRHPAAGVNFVNRIARSPYYVHADSVQLRQVLDNLLNNAVQAMHQGGQVVVRAMAYHGFDTIVLEDNGPGVDPEHRERIFEPFYSTRSQGYGLGLTISQQIIEQHGGTLYLADNRRSGCTFHIRLPRYVCDSIGTEPSNQGPEVVAD